MPHLLENAGAVIFDLDGTLVDSGLDIALSANFVRLSFDLPELPLATAQSYVGDGVVRLLIRTLGHDAARQRTGDNGLPVSEERLQAALGVFREHYTEHMLDHTCLYPGTQAVLAELAALPLMVATNKPREFALRILAELSLDGHFRSVVGGDEPARRKPDPAHLALAMTGLSVPPAQVVMVGDSPNDVRAAQAYGAVSVGCTYGLVPPAAVASAAPDFTIAAITELPPLLLRRIQAPRNSYE